MRICVPAYELQAVKVFHFKRAIPLGMHVTLQGKLSPSDRKQFEDINRERLLKKK